MERIDGENQNSDNVSLVINGKRDFFERPRICCIDLSEEIIQKLTNAGANIYTGTLGSKINVPKSASGSMHYLLLNYDFPLNLHEYDIIIIDLDNFKTVDYRKEDYNRAVHTETSRFLVSSYPQNLFDPRPLGSFHLGNLLEEMGDKPFLVLAFSTEAYKLNYQHVEISSDGHSRKDLGQDYDIYSFWKYIPVLKSKYGVELQSETVTNEFKSLLDKYRDGASYHQVFLQPHRLVEWENLVDDRYTPLFKNSAGDIVSYMEVSDNRNLIMLPQLKNKSGFILDFLSTVGPSLYPSLFPYSLTSEWKKERDYWLPNHLELVNAKFEIEKDYDQKIQEIDKEIEHNWHKFSFLHEILSETGDNLTKALINYFRWLEFDHIEKHDEIVSGSSVLEEDIQIVIDEGLLIIECKGIGGTSTDSDCSQISKIKHRRCKQRGSFDVFALYIVNSQRHLPPLARQMPPFTKHQIEDAINDERGLLATWQLFNLYFDIENGIISKKDARELLLKYGLINFRPSGLTYIDQPKEFFNKGAICIVNIGGVELRKDEEIIIERNGKFEKITVLDIQANGKSIELASNGEFGLKLSSNIANKSILWKQGVKHEDEIENIKNDRY